MEKKKKKKEEKVSVPSAQEPRVKAKLPRRTPAARSGDVVRVSAKDGQSYAEILKAMYRAAARFQARRMPAEGVEARCTWPRSARLPLGA